MLVNVVFLFLFLSTTISGLSDSEAILNFKKSLVVGQENALSSWVPKTPPCTWVGVLCQRGSIRGLQMENLDLSGSIDINALAGLTSLRTLSFMNNNFEGSFPEFKKLVGLKSLFLSKNHFGGNISGNAFEGMGWLKKVHLAENNFTGEISISLTKLPKLLELRLDGNRFTGQIPEFQQKLQVLNLSNNALSGLIPENLKMMDPSMFKGNKGLCGKPLETKCGSPSKELPPKPKAPSPSKESPPPPSTPKKVSSKSPIIITVVAVIALIIIIILIVIILLKRRSRNKHKHKPSLLTEPVPSSLQKKTGIQDVEQLNHRNTSSNVNKINTATGVEASRLLFMRQDRERFNLQDLLKASAEILGSGSFGASYKASLSNGVMMVVKRLKHMNNVGRDEFQEQMKILGSLRHLNILPIVAYYYRKDEKLLVCDFAERGSLAVNLHGNRSLSRQSLNWPTRLKITKGVARGLLCLHQELHSLMAPHGHLKSSNVLLTKNFEPLLTDYGVIPLINQDKAQEHFMAYKSPEYLQQRRITKKTDVWALGILILEILTGKYPVIFLQGDNKNEEDLVSWVNMHFQGKWAKGLFDREMFKIENSEGQIIELLRIGLSCCEPDVEKRLEIEEAVEKIEKVNERDGDDDDFY